MPGSRFRSGSIGIAAASTALRAASRLRITSWARALTRRFVSAAISVARHLESSVRSAGGCMTATGLYEPRELGRQHAVAFRTDDHVSLPRQRRGEGRLGAKHAKHAQRADLLLA